MTCNEYQLMLYEHLMSLALGDKSFLFKDCEVPSQIRHQDGSADTLVEHYRIFTYNLVPSYSEFCLPGALECRGIMYEISKQDVCAVTPLRLASHPLEKFFNLNENPFTMGLDLSKVDLIEDKADGSLIQTFLSDNGSILRLKSKASIQSPQVHSATAWLNHPLRASLKEELLKVAGMDYTVNMEWVSPNNRIVLDYTTEELRILAIRSNIDGSYWDRDELPEWATELQNRWTKRFKECDPVSFVESIPALKDVEGFVVRLGTTGMRVKVKTRWYLAMHGNKASVNSWQKLFLAALEEATDDLKSLYFSDKVALQRIQEMEDLVRTKYREIEKHIDSFYLENHHLSRKDYALLAQKTLDKSIMTLVMAKYAGRSCSVKSYMQANHRRLLLKWGKRDEEMTLDGGREME